MPVANHEEIKKQWPITLPGVGLFFVLCSYMTFSALPRLLDGLISGHPIIRIFPGLILSPLAIVLSLLAVIIYAFIHIPGGAKHLPKFGRFVNFLAFFGFLLMVAVILGATPIQNHFMPKLGYTECKVLDGGPSMWFTDWVKNPEWCVKGKSPEWVFEQAGLPGSLARR